MLGGSLTRYVPHNPGGNRRGSGFNPAVPIKGEDVIRRIQKAKSRVKRKGVRAVDILKNKRKKRTFKDLFG